MVICTHSVQANKGKEQMGQKELQNVQFGKEKDAGKLKIPARPVLEGRL